MFPDSIFAHPTGSFNAPVKPPLTDPDSGSRATVRIGCEWLPYIRGALTQLLLQSTWDTDTAGLALVQQRATLLINLFAGIGPGDCGAEEKTENCLCGEEDCMCCLRYNNGILQMYSCGEWTDVPGQGNSGGITGQPGGDSPIPATGQSEEYCFHMGPYEVRLLPSTVSTGDVITIMNPKGAWSGNSGLTWHCPSGWYMVMGACASANADTSIAALLNSAPYGSLIAKIGPDYYDVYNRDASGIPQPFTVPSGIVNQPVEFHANVNSTLNLGFGEISFCANLQNNGTGTYTHVFDFAAASYPSNWTILNDGGFTPSDIGVWTAGVGYEVEYVNNGVHGLRQLSMDCPVTAHITRVKLFFTWVAGTFDGGPTDASISLSTNVGNLFAVASPTEPTSPMQWDGDQNITAMGLYITAGEHYASTADPGGTGILYRMEVTGVGSDPF